MANVNVLDYLQHVFDPMKMKCSIAKAFSTDEDDDQMEDGEVGGAGRAVGEERTTTATGRKRIEITIKNNSDPESANNGALPVRINIFKLYILRLPYELLQTRTNSTSTSDKLSVNKNL